VAEPDGAVAHSVFDEFVAVDVPGAAALPPFDEPGGQDWILIVALQIAVGAAGDKPVRPFSETLGLREFGSRSHCHIEIPSKSPLGSLGKPHPVSPQEKE
jgi:hypothetical protein